jgi:hypothetical protein
MQNQVLSLKARSARALSLMTLSSVLVIGSASGVALAQSDSANSAPRPTATEGVAPAPGSPLAPPAAPEASQVERGAPQLRQQLPDTASTAEVQSQYGWGLASLILGGVIVAAVVVLLFVMFTRRGWSAHS